MIQKKNREQNYIFEIQKMGLDKKESTTYFNLIKNGKQGLTVYQITKQTGLKRTTIYSILERLVKKQCVKECEQINNIDNKKLFIAEEPFIFFKRIIQNKQNELKELKKLTLKLSDRLGIIYQKGIQYSIQDISKETQKYIFPLINEKWKIISINEEEGKEIFGYDAFDYELNPINSKFIKKCGFLLCKFNYEIEKNKNSLDFFRNQLKYKMEYEIKNSIGNTEYKIEEDSILFFGKNCSIFNIKININDKKTNLEVAKALFITIKNKIFSLWAESFEILEIMVKIIFKG